MQATAEPVPQAPGSALEVLAVFLRLGVSSFGGPIAHLGYFRDEFVLRRRWMDERAYAELVGLCQFLPGPASSQVGFSIGLARAGWAGALAAWVGFTLPSACLLTLFALGAHALTGSVGAGLVYGLKLVAVAIVAQAVWGMARTLCPDRTRAGIALAAALIMLFSATAAAAQIAVIVLGAAAGALLCRATSEAPGTPLHVHVPRAAGLAALGLFLLLLFGLPLLARSNAGVAVFEAFYRAGALVFGGGHVVLPLLREALVPPGWVGEDAFLAGYGAAQAMPGPLFTFAAYLGALAQPGPQGVGGAALGLVGIFLPGLLILVAALPFWQSLRQRPSAQAMVRGVNAAVVGLLAAALYHPVWTGAVGTSADFAVALAGFMLLTVWRAPPIAVVIAGAVAGVVLASIR